MYEVFYEYKQWLDRVREFACEIVQVSGIYHEAHSDTGQLRGWWDGGRCVEYPDHGIVVVEKQQYSDAESA